MSWRLLFFTLLILAGVATVGGLYAGDWLIKHAPVQANLPDITESDPAPGVDEQGRPVLSQPQQPLMNGDQGVPQPTPVVNWKIRADNLTAATTASNTLPVASGQISSKVTSGNAGNIVPVRPIGQDGGVISSGNSWEPAFRAELAKCRTLGFFERSTCVGNTRERYCSQNKAWGKVSDCPAR